VVEAWGSTHAGTGRVPGQGGATAMDPNARSGEMTGHDTGRRHHPLPLEARRRSWDRLWDRLLQPCPHERATPIDEEDAAAPSASFDAGRMAWDVGDGRASDLEGDATFDAEDRR
jgi:hypothetical protein